MREVSQKIRIRFRYRKRTEVRARRKGMGEDMSKVTRDEQGDT